jgi:fructosamine-3-kinase
MFNLQTDLQLTTAQAEEILSAWMGTGVRCTGIDRLTGGMINTVLRLRFSRAPYTAVIKLNQAGAEFDGEAGILRHLYDTGFPCPEVYLVDDRARVVPYTFLLLQTLPGVSMQEVRLPQPDRERVERELADVLVDLHVHTRDTFGAIHEAGTARWADVLMPDLRSIRDMPEISARLSEAVLADVDRAIALAPELLQAQGAPTLIHGDIWAANVIVHEAQDGWHLSGLVDPGSQYADVEMELAYLRSFNGGWNAFFDAYTARCPLRPGYEARWRVYWLRTYLIHVWLFGDQHYREITAQVASQIVATPVA